MDSEPFRSELCGQLYLALDDRPEAYRGPARPVLDRVGDYHEAPLVGRRRQSGRMRSRRVPILEAGVWPYVELARTATSYSGLALDIDKPFPDVLAVRDHVRHVAAADPSWIVRNNRTGHAHAVYALARPVHRYPAARRAPIDQLARIEHWLVTVLQADGSYPAVLTRQPYPLNDLEDTTTWWGPPGGYRFDQLGIPAGWRRPPRTLPDTAIGRNVDTFRAGMAWAGYRSNRARPVLGYLQAHTGEHHTPPLGLGELRHIAKSIERYRAEWDAGRWHKPAWIRRQAKPKRFVNPTS